MTPAEAESSAEGVQKTLNAVERIRGLSCWQSPPHRIRPVPGGRTNQNFFVDVGEQSFFARLGVDLPHHGIERPKEARCNRLAAAAGIAPQVVFAGGGVLVTERIDGRTLVQGDPISGQILDRLAQGLKRLHGVPAPGDLAPFDPVAICRSQLEALPDSALSPERRRRVLSILQRTPDRKSRGLIHADLIPENVIIRNGTPVLVDWEYAGLGDPLVDLALVGVHFGLSDRQLQKFFASYGDVHLDSVLRLMPAIAAREALWCATQIHVAGLAGDLESYDRMCWNRIGTDP